MSLISTISVKHDTTFSEFGEYAPYLSHKTPSECVDAMHKVDKHSHVQGKRDKRGHTLFHFFQKLISKDDVVSNPNRRAFADQAYKKLNAHTLSSGITTQLQAANQHYQSLRGQVSAQSVTATAPVATPPQAPAHKSAEQLITEAEARLDANPTDPQTRHDLACLYMNNDRPIPAMSLFTVAAKQLASKPTPQLTSSDLQHKITKCSEKVQKQAKEISKVAKEIHFNGDITKVAKSKNTKKSKIAKGVKEKSKKPETLLPVEKALIRLFTSSQRYYSVLNAYLRGDQAKVDKWLQDEKISKKMSISFLKETTPIMKHALAKMPTLENLYPENSSKRTVYRGMALTAEHIAKLQQEMKFVNAGFASSSRKMATALAFASSEGGAKEPVLLVTEGRTGVPIHTLSHYEGENEVLFAPKTAFKISEIAKVTKGHELAKQIPLNHGQHLWVVKMKEQIGAA